MSRLIAMMCSSIGGGVGWWLGSKVSMGLGMVLALLLFAFGTHVGFEIVRRYRP